MVDKYYKVKIEIDTTPNCETNLKYTYCNWIMTRCLR